MRTALLTRLDSASPQALRRVLRLIVFIVVGTLITRGTHAGTGDEPHYLMIAHSLVFDGDFALANNYRDPDNLVFAGGLRPDQHAVIGRDGQMRPTHDVGLPLAFAPYFAVAYEIATLAGRLPPDVLRRFRFNGWIALRHLMSLAMILVAGVLASRVFDLCLTSGHKTQAFWWALLCVLSPPLLSHSFLFFTEMSSATLAVSIYYVQRERRLESPWAHAALGFTTGYLWLIHARNIGLVAALVLLYFSRLRQNKPSRTALAAYAAAGAAALGLRTWLNYHFWGTLVTNPMARLDVFEAQKMIWGMVIRLSGWLIDQEHGLLLYAPIYLTMLPGFVVLYRSSRRDFRSLFLPVLLYTVPMMIPMLNPHGWSGGWTPAARFLVPVIPFLAVAGFNSLAGLKRLPFPIKGLVALQCGLTALFWQYPKLLWNDGDGSSALLQFIAPALSKLFPSWHHPSAYSAALSVVILAGWILYSMSIVRRLAANRQPVFRVAS
jgi:hypothetical protein